MRTNKLNAVLTPSGFAAKAPGSKTPLATTTYLSPSVSVYVKFAMASSTLTLVEGAILIVIGVPAGASIYGVAVRNLKSCSL